MRIASRGERLMCTSGHEIARFARDVESGDLFELTDFTDWKIKQPQPSDPIENCPHCGAQYLQTQMGSFRPHVEGEWRSNH